MTDKHIGSNFDDFLKEENIHIPIHSEWFLNPLEAYDQIKKELSRKEQECEELKENLPNAITRLMGELDQLKAENEELKIYIESNEQQVKEVETLVMDNDRLINELDLLKEELAISIQENEEGREINAELKAENDTYKKMLEDEDVQFALNEVRTGERHLWYNKAQRLEQALTEIKEIANKFDYWNNNLSQASEILHEIIEKISEVLDE